MSSEYRKHLESLGFIAREHKTKTWKVHDDDNGRVAGYQTEHKDGRLDATVTPKVVRGKSEPKGIG